MFDHHRPRKICIVGTGYVGMASATGFAELGHHVTGYDIDTDRVRKLQHGQTPYREAGIEEALQRHLLRGRIDFHADPAAALLDCDYAVIAVGTPSLRDGSADLRAVETAMATVAPLLPRHGVIVLRSTVPPGTSERFAATCSRAVLYAPEFLREGSALFDFLNPDRIVVGTDRPELAADYADLLSALERPVVVTGFRNAELIKAFSNAFLALKISFANEVANFCDAVDADALAVLDGVGHDRRIGKAFLAPGIGFGGPCFEKDVRSLHHVASERATSRELLSATLRVNAAQPRRIVDLLEAELGALDGVHVGVWGLTFKAGTDDVRDSLALRIVDDLLSRGALPVAYDPAIAPPRSDLPCEVVGAPMQAIAGADALLVLTEWPEFAQIPALAIARTLRRGVVIDGRNVLDANAIATAGIRYRGVGRRAGLDVDLAAAS